MKHNLRLFFSIAVCVAIGFGEMTLNSGYEPKEYKDDTTGYNRAKETKQSGNTDSYLTKASTPPSQKDKYILKYYEDTNKINLIIKYKDGSQIISPIETINPDYLTDEDIQSLKKGIELSSKEDMFILIEDYSS